MYFRREYIINSISDRFIYILYTMLTKISNYSISLLVTEREMLSVLKLIVLLLPASKTGKILRQCMTKASKLDLQGTSYIREYHSMEPLDADIIVKSVLNREMSTFQGCFNIELGPYTMS